MSHGRSPTGSTRMPRLVAVVTVVSTALGLVSCTAPAINPRDPGTLTPSPELTTITASAEPTPSQPSSTTPGSTASVGPSASPGPTATPSATVSPSMSASTTLTDPPRRRPSWVQLIFGIIPAGQVCLPGNTVVTGSAENHVELERLGSMTLCFDEPPTNAEIEIDSPPTTPEALPIAEQTRVTWLLAPPRSTTVGALGTHSFRVASSSGESVIETSGTITVVPARTPRWAVVASERMVLMAGLTPGTRVLPTVYGPPTPDAPADAVASVHADLPPVTVDARGEAGFTWEPETPPPPGTYAVWLENGPPACHAEGRACRFLTIG